MEWSGGYNTPFSTGDDGDRDYEDEDMLLSCRSCCNHYSSRQEYRRHCHEDIK